jgi:hypothetical protein
LDEKQESESLSESLFCISSYHRTPEAVVLVDGSSEPSLQAGLIVIQHITLIDF